MKKILVLQSGPSKNNMKYSNWVAGLGAAPVILPYISKNKDEHILAALEAVDGVLLPGGIDIHPMMYNSENYSAYNVDNVFDKWQLDVLDAAVKLQKPVYGICRGHQIIGVYLGGDIIQDIDSSIKDSLVHNQNDNNVPRGVAMHKIFENGAEIEWANSLHHQSVNPTPELKKKATFNLTAEDGVVEGIIANEYAIQSVQFHPEEMNSKEWNNRCRTFFGIEIPK